MRYRADRNRWIAAAAVLVLTAGFVTASTSTGRPSGGGDGKSVIAGLKESLRGWLGITPEPARLEPTAQRTVPVRQAVPTGVKAPAAKRVRELVAQRTETASFYQLSDGRIEAEVAAAPVRYRDARGRLQPVDTTVVTSQGVLQNTTNVFGTKFGPASTRLVGFDLKGHHVDIGLAGPQRTLTPSAKGDTVTYRGAFPGADLRYRVTGGALKDEIVLANADAAGAYAFTLDLHGLTARALDGGAIGLFDVDGPDRPLLVLPAPFMFDSRPDAGSPYGVAWSPKVTQTLTQDGDQLTVTVRPDAGWLADPARVFPVVIDPTIKVQPTPTQSQDAMIVSDDPGTNYDGNWRLSVGTTATAKARSLVKFDLSAIPAGTKIDTASLQLYFDQDHTTSAYDVPLEARRVTSAWTETGVTWNNINTALGEAGANVETVDDTDTGKVAISGEWPASTNTAMTQYAVNSTYLYNKNAVTGEKFTWVPKITETGDYLVEAHYVAASDRATAAPYTIAYNGGTVTQTVNQTSGTNGVWTSLGTYNFAAGTSGSIALGDVSSSSQAVIADAVRLTKAGTATKKANQSSVWHSFGVRNIVQSWVDGTANYGFAVKAVDEATLGRGGPRYEAAEYAYNGENENTPKLVVTYGKPGAQLDAPTKIFSTGAELHWSAYAGSDILEYQVHRSVYQTFTPTAATLVSPVNTGTTTFTDTTATPTPVDSTDPFGQVYYYMVAVKTTSGQVIPAPTQIVRLPRAGRIVQILQGDALDTTLSSTESTAGHDVLAGNPWLSVGNNSGTYGTTRAAVKFPGVSTIPANARVLDAEFDLWSVTTQPAAGATYDVHALTKAFDETSATWAKANSTTSWTTAGGDYNSTVDDIVTGNSNDPAWRLWWVDSAVQNWVTTPASNYGLLVRLANETTPAERTLFLSSEAAEPQLRPKLVVTYTLPEPAQTYYAPETPLTRMAPGVQDTVPVTVSNPTTTTWPAATWELSYHWTLPDGTDVTPGNQVATALPADVTPGQAVTVNAALKAPTQSEAINDRAEYVVRWELHNKTTGQWLSTTAGIASLDQTVVVEEPTSDELGQEGFYQYAGTPTGSGSSAAVNLHSGNAVWSYEAFSNPSRGLPTFSRMSYNSLDTASPAMGFGWSISAATLHRLGSPLQFHPPGQSWPTEVTLVDGDGTSHTFTLNKHGSTDPAQWDYDHPHGVHLYLQKNAGGDDARAWTMTRPDRSRYFFDTEGYQTAYADNNGNELQFTYEERKSNNKPTKFLRYVTDPDGRRTLEITYYAKGDAYTYVDDTTWTEASGTNLTNPKIIDQIKSVVDVAGRRIDFLYTVKGLMAKMTDGAGSAQPKVFRFTYDMTQGNKNVKLLTVTDPRGHVSKLSYYDPPGDDPKFHWWAKTLTDRLNGVTAYAYVDPDGPQGDTLTTTVTDAEQHNTVFQLDALGRRTQATDALNQTTKTGWDADHNVIRIEEPNGAVTTATYDQITGLPLTRTDAEANRNGTAPERLTYQTGLQGHIADLVTQTTPLGNVWTYTYDPLGNLKSITDPEGSATATAGDYTSTFAYDNAGRVLSITDADGHTSRYADFDPSGQPKSVTDALGNTTTMTFDARGNVLTITDARGKTSSATFDLYGRALDSRKPRDAAAGQYVVTPAPTYDANDNVTVSPAPNGAVSTATYDDADEVVSESAPKDTASGPARTTTHTYDKMGNRLSTTEPRGTLTSDPADFVTRYTYDATYRRTSIVDTDGGVTAYTYDSVGNITKIVDPKRTASSNPDDYSVLYRYDLNHRAVGATDPVGNTSAAGYDLDGRMTSTTDEIGAVTQLAYDRRGLLIERTIPYDTGVANTTRFGYDQAGNRVKVTSPRGVATTDDPDDFAEVTVYDELNRIKEQQTAYDRDDPTYNVAEKTIRTYDAVGNLVKVSLPPSGKMPGVAGTRVDTTYTYTDDGLIASETDAWGITTQYAYDSLSQQTSRTVTGADGGLSRTMRWTYYPDGKLQHREDDGVPKGSNVVLGDNSDTEFTATAGPAPWTTSSAGSGYLGPDYLTHAAGTGANSVTWTSSAISEGGSYEVFVRFPAVAGAATNATYVVRDKNGVDHTVVVDQTQHAGEWVSLGVYDYIAGTVPYAVKLTDNANGVVVADAVKRVRVYDPSADDEQQTFDYAYDVNGNLTQLTDASSGAQITGYAMAYNGLNQVSSMVEKRGAVDAHTATYQYDLAGNLTERTYDARIDSFEYDARDLVSKVTNKQSAGDLEPKVTTYGYTPRAQLAMYTKPLGNRIEFEYYLDGRLKHQKETQDFFNRTVAEHTVKYDPNGNTTEDVQRLMNAENADATIDRTLSYKYDPRDRVVEVNKEGLRQELYTYDANSNILSEIFAESPSKNTIVSNSYDRNRLTKTISLSYDGMGGQTGSTSSYYYDPLGRLTFAPTDQAYVWYHYDGFDRKIKHEVYAGGGSTAFVTDYQYDPLDRVTHTTRLVKTPDSGEKTVNTDYQYIGASGLLLDENRDNGRVHTFYSYGLNGERLWQDTTATDGSPSAQYFYSYNPHGDVEAITIPSGTTDATYGYTAYGSDDAPMFTGVDKPDPNNPNKEPVNTFRYSARQWDQASGTYDMGFRDYSPLLSRFLTPDAYRGALADQSLTANPATANQYRFTGGNPINSVEINGHYSWGEFWEDVVNVGASIVVFSACNILLDVETLGAGMLFCAGLSMAVYEGLEYASNPQEGGHTAGGMAAAVSWGFLEGVAFAPIGFFLGKGLGWLGGKAIGGLYRLIRAEGSQAGAEILQQRAAALQKLRPWAGGTTSVMKVQNKWFPFLRRNWVAIEDAGKMPEAWEGMLAKGERFIQGPGHAEQTIIDKLGRSWWIVEGGTNRNVCLAMATGACGPALERLGITIGGKIWPWKEYAFGKYLGLKTDFRTFWYSH